MRILTLLAGAAIGYVLGARAGREKYEAIRTKASEIWDDPDTKAKVDQVTNAVKEKAPGVANFIKEKSPEVADKVKETKDTVTDKLGKHHPESDGDTGSASSGGSSSRPQSYHGSSNVAGTPAEDLPTPPPTSGESR
ncbi:hypothetical protein GCM10022377_13540 [Zhihengliuella alba]|uniref:YtxH domain-containing protein n=1 Tax=Zhihengliuella alba TaxID=547018 RepID=A0ABP7DA15_9MICC